MRDGQATGGSTTSIIDTVRPNGESAAQFLNGTAIITYDAGGAGAAPEGQWSRITSYTASSKTFALANTLTAAVAVGDHYVVSTKLFQHNELIRLMNEALRHRKLGSSVPLSDTSITVSAGQSEYTLPLGAKENAIRGVWVQTNLGDTDDNQWEEIYNYHTTWTAPGSTGLIILPSLSTGHTVKIVYTGVHPAITAYSTPISEYIAPDLAVSLLVERMAHALTAKTKNSAEPFRIGWDMAKDQLDEALLRNPIYQPLLRARMPDIAW